MPKYKTPKSFPGSEMLPELGQQLLQRFFPADELPTPATVISPYGRVSLDSLKTIGRKSLGKNFDDWGIEDAGQISKLANNIKENGLKNPVALDIGTKGTDWGPHLKDGIHRIFAASKLGLKELPVNFNLTRYNNPDDSAGLIQNMMSVIDRLKSAK